MIRNVTVVIDSIRYKEKKAASEDTGRMKSRLSKKSSGELIPLDKLADELANGCTFYPSYYDGNGLRKENWRGQDLFVLDIDGDLGIEEAYDRAVEYGITPAFIYKTLSCTDEVIKFRIIFCSDRTITDGDYRDRIQRIFMALFPECDPRCIDRARIFFGGKEIVYPSYDATFDPDELIAKYADRECIPIKEEPKKKKKAEKKATAKGEQKKSLSKKKETWDVGKAVGWAYTLENDVPWGKGLDRCNAEGYAEALKDYFEANGADYMEGDGRENILFCYYCLRRTHECLIDAVYDTIGLNMRFGCPLSNGELESIVDAAECHESNNKSGVKRGYSFSPETIHKYCGMNAEVIPIGRREAARNYSDQYNENQRKKMDRVRELCGKGMSSGQISAQLEKEGFSQCSKRSVRRWISQMGTYRVVE